MSGRSSRHGLTRREALGLGLRAGVGFGISGAFLAGCGRGATVNGSTLHGTWIDPIGDGQLRPGPGEALLDRTELAPAAATGEVLATIAHVTDSHVMDASSPARIPFLDRLGTPFQSTFRPQEALTVQVLTGAVTAIHALRPDIVIQGGDLIDNAQSNELDQALRVLRGGPVDPGSGPRGYIGVQLASNPDPFYYRPDVDAPRFPGLLRAAGRRVAGPGLGAPCVPVFGDHDPLVAGEVVPTELTRTLAVGDRALWDLPSGLAVPPDVRRRAVSSPDGPPDPGLVDRFLREALAGSTVRVPADSRRRELGFAEASGRLLAGAAPGVVRGGATAARLDYAIDVGRHLRLVVIDLVRRDGGSGGLVVPGQVAWLAQALASARGRSVIAVSHQPLEGSNGGDDLLAVLDRSPNVLAALSGHTHRNRIAPRRSPAGGYWLISTASLIDYPQQARALRLVRTTAGRPALQTWMLDHALPGQLGAISRQLSYLDAQGGRPSGFDGGRRDRNVALYR